MRLEASNERLSGHETLVSLFAASVESHRDRMAVMFEGCSLTYGELDGRADELAALLRAAGIGPGDLVGVWLPRSPAVYVAILGVLKAGAGYVPCDEDAPGDRVVLVLRDCEAAALVSIAGLTSTIEGLLPECVLMGAGSGGGLDGSRLGWGGSPARPRQGARRELEPSDTAYVIYTSGSTGRPKGVVVSHANVMAFVDAEAQVFDVAADDRVWQGFSVSFDASVEELWLAWRTGAALVCATKDMVRSGPDLAEVLGAHGVTVLSCVPTLLGMFDGDLPGVRLLILGGEACAAEVARRWCRPGRRVVNTYGPTETTVVATWAELGPDRPVRIGVGLPGYQTWVVSPELDVVADGVVGELVVGGPAVTQGYLGRPELTAEKFIRPVWATGERVYRTGDLVRVDAAGDLEFLGRIDDQVKLRGYRIELGEVDAALQELPGVAAATSTVHRYGNADVLVGYVRLRPDAVFDEIEARRQLGSTLTGAMVPGRFVVVEEFPRLTSGKIDRKALPDPSKAAVADDNLLDLFDAQSWTEVELELRAAYARVLPGVRVTRTTNFFASGGDSLAATEFVSGLRDSSRFRSVSVRDLYQNPVLGYLAAHLETMRTPPTPGAARVVSEDDLRESDPPEDQDCAGVSGLRYGLCGLVQTLALYPLLAIMSPPWMITFVAFYGISQQNSQHRVSVAALFGVLVLSASAPVRMALCVATKWVVLGRVRPGRYRLWGAYYLRFWFVNRVQDMLSFDQLRGTPLMNTYLKLMGASVGEGAHCATDDIRVPDLLRIGRDATVDHDAMLVGYQISDGWLHIGRITIGDGARVGVRAAMAYDTELGAGAELGDGAMLSSGASVPPAQHWTGSPARPVGALSDSWPSSPPPATKRPRLGYSVGFTVLSLIPVIAVLPEAALFGYIDNRFCDFTKGYWDIWKLVVTAPIAALTFIVTLSMLIAVIKRVAMPVMEAGLYPLHSNWHVRKWFTDSLLHLSLDLLFPMYGSLYLPPWLRLMGARLGRDVELSTASDLNPDLIDIGQGAFVADNVSLGASTTHRGWVRLDTVRIGRNSFVGNSAVVPAGTELGDDVLIGVQSMPPSDPIAAARNDSSWLGIPPIELPTRLRSTDFAEQLTYQPTTRRKALRAFIEFWRIITPLTLVTIGSLMLLLVAEDLADRRYGLRLTLVVFPLLLGAMGLLLALIVIAAKWILVGRYRPQVRPLWDNFVWRSEFVNALHENVAMGVAGQLVVGTPMLAVYLRAMGAHIGRRTCLESSYLTEFDLVHIDDEVALNQHADVQTHLFEDRVMRMSTVHLQTGSSVGPRSIVLYDATLGPGARIDALSLVMKGERIPAHSHWHGSPAEPVTPPPHIVEPAHHR